MTLMTYNYRAGRSGNRAQIVHQAETVEDFYVITVCGKTLSNPQPLDRSADCPKCDAILVAASLKFTSDEWRTE